MSNDTIKGEIRPTAIRPVSLATLEKRVRRHLAKSGCTLIKSRPGTRQHDTLGEYSIFDDQHELVTDKVNVTAWARSYGLLAEDEALAEAMPETWLTVVIPAINDHCQRVGLAIGVRARHLTKPLRDTIRDHYARAGACIEADATALETLLSGWRHVTDPDGKPLPFNRDNARILVDNYPNATRVILDKMLEVIAKGGKGHE